MNYILGWEPNMDPNHIVFTTDDYEDSGKINKIL